MEKRRVDSIHDESGPALDLLTCQHCRTPIESHSSLVKDSKERTFCCPGCRAVFQLLEEKGLTYFYTLTEKLGGEIPSLYRHSTPSHAHSQSFGDHGSSSARLVLEGIQCASCVWLLERLPEVCHGVRAAKVRLSEGDIGISWDPDVTNLDSIIAAIEALGYRIHMPEARETRHVSVDRELLIQLGVAAACAMNVMVLAVSLYQGLFTGIEARFEALFRWASLALSIPAVGYSALPIYKRALGALRAGSLHIDIPIALGIALSFVLSATNTIAGSGEIYFDSLTAIIFLLLSTRYLHHRAFDNARRRCTSRWFLLPATIREVLPTGEECTVPLAALRSDMVVAVSAGERIPCDGIVETGTSSIDASAITGESFPQMITTGSAVLAGCLNIEGPLRIRSVTERGTSRLDRILAAVSESISHPPGFITKLDTLSMVFTAAALLLGIGAFFSSLSAGISHATSAAIAMLTVTCPCAIALALPLLSMRALSTAAQHGLLVKSPNVFEDVPKVSSFFLDKTGTLTYGEMSVAHVNRASGCSDDALSTILTALVSVDLAHPVSRAVASWCAETLPTPLLQSSVSQLVRLPGRGVQGIWEGQVDGEPLKGSHEILLCSYSHFTSIVPEQKVDVDALVRHEATCTVVVLAVDSQPIAVFELSDSLREESKLVLREIGARGDVWILSGDRQAVVNDVGAQLQLKANYCLGELLPEAKADYIGRASGVTLFAGDGANDAPALSTASIGVALRGGIQSILECADVFVSSGGIESLRLLNTIALRYKHRSRLLVRLGLFYNTVGIGAAFLGFVTPLVAAIAMPTFSSLVVFIAYSAFWGLGAPTTVDKNKLS